MIPSRQPFKRADRVADVLRMVVSEILVTKVHHNRALDGVTVTGAEVTNDLQHAKIYYRVIDPNKKDGAARSLQGIRPFVRKELGRQMKLRYTPDLRFQYDESLDYGSKIESLLASLHQDEE